MQQQRLSNISNGIRGLHLGDYERDLAAHRGDTREARYLSRKVNVAVPGQGGWRDESLSYWAMGIEFALRLEEASRVSITHTTSGLNCSTEMRGMAYVFENVLRSAIPAFEETVSLAEQRAAKVQYFVTAVNYGALAGLGGRGPCAECVESPRALLLHLDQEGCGHGPGPSHVLPRHGQNAPFWIGLR